jgi:hypothetical protein
MRHTAALEADLAPTGKGKAIDCNGLGRASRLATAASAAVLGGNAYAALANADGSCRARRRAPIARLAGALDRKARGWRDAQSPDAAIGLLRPLAVGSNPQLRHITASCRGAQSMKQLSKSRAKSRRSVTLWHNAKKVMSRSVRVLLSEHRRALMF